MRKGILLSIIFLLLFQNGIRGQPNGIGLDFEVSLSPEAGRWVYNPGKDETGSIIGYDRSFLSFLTALETGVYIETGKWRTGLFFNFRMLFENTLISSQHSIFSFQAYKISNFTTMNFYSLGISESFKLVDYGNFTFSPKFGLGTFFVETVHPGKERFGAKLVWSAGVICAWQRKGKIFFLEPHFTNYVIIPNKNGREGELNQIYSLGMKVGFRFQVGKKKAIKKNVEG